MHFYGWKRGLKTGIYYLRTRPSAQAIQFTIDAGTLKRESRLSQAVTGYHQLKQLQRPRQTLLPPSQEFQLPLNHLPMPSWHPWSRSKSPPSHHPFPSHLPLYLSRDPHLPPPLPPLRPQLPAEADPSHPVHRRRKRSHTKRPRDAQMNEQRQRCSAVSTTRRLVSCALDRPSPLCDVLGSGFYFGRN